MWTALIGMGMSMLGGAAERSAQKANNILADGKAVASNIVREGQNIEGAAKASFAGFMSTLNNNRGLDAAGRARGNAQANLERIKTSITRGSIEDQIANSEAAGAYTAAVAMNGGGGSSISNISRAMALKQQRSDLFTKERGKQMTHDQMQQIVGIMPQQIAGMDIGTYSASIDYSTTFSEAKPVQGNALLDVAKWALNNPGGAQQIAGGAGGFFSSSASRSSSSLYSLPTGGQGGLGLRM